jgi:hypothetical protein
MLNAKISNAESKPQVLSRSRLSSEHVQTLLRAGSFGLGPLGHLSLDVKLGRVRLGR